MPYGREECSAIAADLAAKGIAVWNIEYRRLGEPGGGWPGTLRDVQSAVDHLANLVSDGVKLDLSRVAVAGHSAGGHLALWAPAQHSNPELSIPVRVRPIAAVGMAPVSDLLRSSELNLGKGAAAEFLGGPPDHYPDRTAAASPIALLPLGVRQLILHGMKDDAVPVDMSRRYAEVANQNGDKVDFVELADAGHMDFLDPASKAHKVFADWIAALFETP